MDSTISSSPCPAIITFAQVPCGFNTREEITSAVKHDQIKAFQILLFM